MATVLTQVGEEWIVDLIDGTVSAQANWIGWGTGGTAAAKNATDLSTAAPEARASTTRTQATTDRIRWVGTITATGTRGITNAGVFYGQGSGSPPTGGTPLIVMGDFTTVNVVSGDSIQFTIELEIT